jgi:hypothetical protein
MRRNRNQSTIVAEKNMRMNLTTRETKKRDTMMTKKFL